MIITAERINNIPVTIIKKPFDPVWVRQQLAMGVPVVAELKRADGAKKIIVHASTKAFGAVDWQTDGIGTLYSIESYAHTVTILPALPRRPTADDVGLIAQYMAQGLYIFGNGSPYWNDALLADKCGLFLKTRYGDETQLDSLLNPFEITHAVNASGEKVDVAIVDGEVHDV